MKELITEICNRYNIELSSEELQQFEKFLEIFIETNTSINLSAIREAKEIIEKHFIDSIMLDVFFSFTNSSYKETDLEVEGIPSKNHIKIADMGTGGGFPLIPLAIIHPEIEFIGIDSVGKKLSAINTFIDTLGLSNASTLQ
ncbi:MAG: class I SAM-dependent methyltransferase [Candidatus Peribacteria bacterium]|nr:MAG: class I SAM-dependent methyltransferase [Candidatus Peribacteria bacterium]